MAKRKRKPAWIADGWKLRRAEIKAEKYLSRYFDVGPLPGLERIEAYHRDLPMPIGVVWYSFVGLTELSILNSFVFEKVRRCGVRTYLHRQLLAAYPHRKIIISADGTASGAAWMKATGYKQTKRGWEYAR